LLGSDLGVGTLGTLGGVPSCACTSVLAALALIAIASAASGTTHFGVCEGPATFSDGCSLDMLTFYYDDDDELQCECPDDADDEEWCFARGLV
jgi:hypothetical protein